MIAGDSYRLREAEDRQRGAREHAQERRTRRDEELIATLRSPTIASRRRRAPRTSVIATASLDPYDASPRYASRRDRRTSSLLRARGQSAATPARETLRARRAFSRRMNVGAVGYAAASWSSAPSSMSRHQAA